MLALIKKWIARRKEKKLSFALRLGPPPRVQVCIDEADMHRDLEGKALLHSYAARMATGQGLLNSVAIPQSGGGGGGGGGDGGVAIRAFGKSYAQGPAAPKRFDALYSVRRYHEYASSYVNAYLEQRKMISNNMSRKYELFTYFTPVTKSNAVTMACAEIDEFNRELEQRFPKVHLIEQDVVDIGAELDILNMAQQPLDAVRVFFNERTLQIEVLSFDRPLVDLGLQEVYDSLADMPLWLTERLDVLHVMPAEPPTEEIAGIGRRIGARIFWVYVPSELTS